MGGNVLKEWIPLRLVPIHQLPQGGRIGNTTRDLQALQFEFPLPYSLPIFQDIHEVPSCKSAIRCTGKLVLRMP